MNLKELEYVVAIADEKSLTKAAERLFITPSALTQQVLRLENELHAPLFIRSRSGWQPTEAGEIYLEAARKILFIRQDAYNRLQDQIQRSAYSLTIGLPPERGTDMFSRIYAPFRERFPDVTIQLRETSVHTQQDLIRSGQLDLGFLTLSEAQMTKDEYVSLWRKRSFWPSRRNIRKPCCRAPRPSRVPLPGRPSGTAAERALCHDERSFDPAPDPGGHLPPERPAAAGRL